MIIEAVYFPESFVRWTINALKKAGYTPEDLLLLGQPQNQQFLEEFRLVLDGRAEIVYKRIVAQEESDQEKCGYSGA